MLFSCRLTGSLILIGIVGGSGRGWGWCRSRTGRRGGLSTRTAGVALLLVGPVFLLRQRHFRKAAAFLCGMAPAVAGWSWWVAAMSHRWMITLKSSTRTTFAFTD